MNVNTTRFGVISLIAFLAALAILAWSGKYRPYDEQLIHIQAERILAPIDARIMNEPADLQVLLLSYGSTGDRTLTLQAWIALDAYPAMAPDIFARYGAHPNFQTILHRYGKDIIPVIHYFMVNDVLAIQAERALGKTLQNTTQSARKLWQSLSGQTPAFPPAPPASPPIENTPETRGAYAIRQIEADGHDLLGQFVIDRNGQVSRIQTKRVTQDIGDFLTSGLVNLERKSDTGTPLSTGDYASAAADTLLFATAFKLLRAGRSVAVAEQETATAGKATNTLKTSATRTPAQQLISRTRIFGASLMPHFPFLTRLGTWGAAIATTYVLLRHPSLINSLLGGLAHALDVPTWSVQLLGWFLIVGLLLSLLNRLTNLIWRPVRLGLHFARGARRILMAVFVRARRPRSTAGTSPDTPSKQPH